MIGRVRSLSDRTPPPDRAGRSPAARRVPHTRPVERVRDGDVWVIGDVHGEFEKALTLLRTRGFVDREARWSGGTASLWFIGDLTDRGPHGIEVIDLVMRLQREAAAAGGTVGCLMGNHDAWYTATEWGRKKAPYDRSKEDWVQEQLDLLPELLKQFLSSPAKLSPLGRKKL